MLDPLSKATSNIPDLPLKMLEAMSLAVIATDAAGTILYWNAAAESLYGWPASEVVGKNVVMVTVPQEAMSDAANVMSLLRQGRSWSGEFRVQRKDGTQFNAMVTNSPVFDSSGILEAIVGFSHDLAAAEKAEEQRRSNEDQFRTLANSLPELCWMAKGDGHIFWYNQRWYDYTGSTPQAMEGWGWKSVHDPEYLPLVMERWLQSIQSGKPFEMEFPLRGHNGEFRWFITRVQPLRDAAGNVIRWFGTNANIEELRQKTKALGDVQQQLETLVSERTAELNSANQSLRNLSATLMQLRDEERRRIARELHDSVGQLIAAISMNISVVQSQITRLDAAGQTAVTQNAELIAEINRQIRTISHLLHPPLLDEVGVSSALRWYVEGFSERSKINVDLQIDPDLGRLGSDVEIASFRIIQECLTNIHRHAQSASAHINIQQSPQSVTISVKDEGKGIPAEKLLALQSLERSGVGFRGMRERVRQLGGNFEIRSDKRGTVIQVVLPVESASAESGKTVSV